jgi:AmmeMemoRadiSam system protein B/AmmeMemoRadiSam system protein A
MQPSHASPFAGQWYPADRSELGELIKQKMDESRARSGYVRRGALAFVVPHAAPMYCGTVAASAYRHIAACAPRRIILLGFSHRRSLPGIGVPQVSGIATPIGTTEIDAEGVRETAAHWPFRIAPETQLCDHSVEIQLPYLQKAAPDAAVLPLYVGALSAAERVAAASRLRGLLNESAIIVASSDFTHYGRSFGYMPFPLDDATPQRLEQLDMDVMSASSGLNPELFLEEIRRMQSTVCGYAPIALLLEILRGHGGEEIFQECLDYQTSGELTSDYAHSVSYGALGYFRESAFSLSEGAAQLLLASSRKTLDRLQATGERMHDEPEPDTEFEQRRSVFVTLYQGGELRGCIGSCHSKDPISRLVPRLTLSAALEDTRFDPLTNYVPVDIEISLLTPFKRIRRGTELVAGEHGGLIEYGNQAGLLLPKVATEHQWNTAKFLEVLAWKAGLPPKIEEKPGARLSVFRAQVFRDAAVRTTAAGTVQ